MRINGHSLGFVASSPRPSPSPSDIISQTNQLRKSQQQVSDKPKPYHAENDRGGTSTILAAPASPQPNMTDESDTRDNLPNETADKM